MCKFCAEPVAQGLHGRRRHWACQAGVTLACDDFEIVAGPRHPEKPMVIVWAAFQGRVERRGVFVGQYLNILFALNHQDGAGIRRRQPGWVNTKCGAVELSDVGRVQGRQSGGDVQGDDTRLFMAATMAAFLSR